MKIIRVCYEYGTGSFRLYAKDVDESSVSVAKCARLTLCVRQWPV